MVAWCTQAVDEGGGDHGVAADLAPGLEPAIARNDDGAALVAARDQGEHEVGGSPLERDVADLADDEQLAALKPLELLVEDVRSCASSRRETLCHSVATATRWPWWRA